VPALRPAPLRSSLGVNVRARERTAQRRAGISSLREQNTVPFPAAPRSWLLPRLCRRSPAPRRGRRRGAQGALYAPGESHRARGGFAVGHGGIRGRAVRGGALQTPRTGRSRAKRPLLPALCREPFNCAQARLSVLRTPVNGTNGRARAECWHGEPAAEPSAVSPGARSRGRHPSWELGWPGTSP